MPPTQHHSADDLIVDDEVLPETGELVFAETLPAEESETVRATRALPARLASKLPFDGVFTHQEKALSALADGENVSVATSTSSGKTLVYALHIARRYLKDSENTFLLLYPTKALARDQQTELTDLFDTLGLNIDVRVYDGDVTQTEKEDARENADVIITNFAGLNAYLPHHENWQRILRNLELVVIDESHSYTGVLGMHAAWITRRLDRLADHYDASPQYACTSATIGNPEEHAKRLTGKDVTVIEDDGSPQGRRDLLFFQPQAADGVDSGGSEDEEVTLSAHRTASDVLAEFSHAGYQSLLFAESRKMTELNAMWARRKLRQDYGDSETTVHAYNAGHTKGERRTLEDNLKDGSVDGVATTSALEMGINVGSVDSAILAGYPGTRQSFWQRLGRAGRDEKSATGVFVAHNDPLDQYILSNPDHVLDTAVEDAVIDLANNNVFATHLRVAASELPLTRRDENWFGDRLEAAVEMFTDGGEFSGVLESPDGVRFVRGGQPELGVDIYATSKSTFEVVLRDDSGNITSLPNADQSRAYRDFHPGAIYLHRGSRYEVVDFDEASRRIVLEPTDADYYTEVNREVVVDNLNRERSRVLGDGLTLHWGDVQVKEYYPSFVKRDSKTDRAGKTEETGISVPATMQTHAAWLTIEAETAKELSSDHSIKSADELSPENPMIEGGLEAATNALVNLAPAELLLESSDLGSSTKLAHQATDGPTMFIYDTAPGGVGFSRRLYEQLEQLVARASNRIESCSCDRVEGCPKCVLSTGNTDEDLNSRVALDVLTRIQR